MKKRIYRLSAAGILVAALLPFSAAYAQLGNLLKQGENSSGSSALGNLGGIGSALSGSSMTSGSLGNVAGLLQFCIKNNYLGGDSAAAVQNSLMGKLPGGASTSDSGYTSGASGLLSGSNGGQMNLSGGGLKAEVTKKVCDQVLAQGKSML